MRSALVTVLMTSTLCGPLFIFSPVLVKDVLHGDASQFSLSIGAFGVGGLVGSVGLLGVEAGYDSRKLSSGFAAAYGGLTAVAAINPWILMLARFAMSISKTSANSLLQAPPRLRGRTISLCMLAMRAVLSSGSLTVGITADLIGIRYALLVNGALALAAHMAIGRRWLQAGPPAFVQRPQTEVQA